MPGAVTYFRRRFQAEGDAASAQAQQAYMKTTLLFHGVDAKQMRTAARAYCAAHALDHAALVALGHPADARAQTLAPDEFVALTEALRS